MEALRRLASFSNDVVLDEVTLQKAKEAAVAVKTLEARSDKLLST